MVIANLLRENNVKDIALIKIKNNSLYILQKDVHIQSKASNAGILQDF